MGGTYVANTSSFSSQCTKDADCYAAVSSLSVAAATTDAEKKKRCCQYMGYTTAPDQGTAAQKALGATTQLSLNLNYGLPLAKGDYTRFCNNDYPATLPVGKGSNTLITYDTKTGLVQYPIDYGKMATTQYCDGGAKALAVAGAVALATAISL